MKLINNNRFIRGSIGANPSKSIMQRVLVLSALAEGSTKIFNPTFDTDSNNALELIKKLNCEVNSFNSYIEIDPAKIETSLNHTFNCGESGLLMRMIAPVLSSFMGEYILEAEGSLMNRELYEVEEVLSYLGAKVKSNRNFPPIKIKGPIHSGNIKLIADKTSQFLTGLLITLTQLEKISSIEVLNLTSKPYIDLTIDLIQKFGGKIEWVNNKEIIVYPTKYLGQNITIEGDWSSSAVFLIAAAIAGEVTVKGLNFNSKQGDKVIMNVLEHVGATIECHSEQCEESKFLEDIKENEGIQVDLMDSSGSSFSKKENLSLVTVKKNNLKPFEYDAKDTPDLVPYLAILAANCDGKSIIQNVNRINFKESKRLNLTIKNLSNIGIRSNIEKDSLSIWAGKITGGNFETGNDHRMSMAGALASLNSENGILIENPDCVKKSYPNFWIDFNSLIKIQNPA